MGAALKLDLDDEPARYCDLSGFTNGMFNFSGSAPSFSPGSYTYLKDHLGTTQAIANINGTIIQKYAYSAYGVILGIRDGSGNDITSSPVINTSYTFTGREYDRETGLYYYRARYYDASIGRFLQMDPEPGRIASPITVTNRYAYTGNNPQFYTDPSGKIFGIDDLVLVIGAGLIRGGIKAFAKENFSFDQFLSGFIEGMSLAALTIVASQGFGLLAQDIVDVFSTGNLGGFLDLPSAAGAGASLVGDLLSFPALIGISPKAPLAMQTYTNYFGLGGVAAIWLSPEKSYYLFDKPGNF